MNALSHESRGRKHSSFLHLSSLGRGGREGAALSLMTTLSFTTRRRKTNYIRLIFFVIKANRNSGSKQTWRRATHHGKHVKGIQWNLRGFSSSKARKKCGKKLEYINSLPRQIKSRKRLRLGHISSPRRGKKEGFEEVSWDRHTPPCYTSKENTCNHPPPLPSILTVRRKKGKQAHHLHL